jgi:hypothetical protein
MRPHISSGEAHRIAFGFSPAKMRMLAADHREPLAPVRGNSRRRGAGASSVLSPTTVFEIYCLDFDPHPSEPSHPQCIQRH